MKRREASVGSHVYEARAGKVTTVGGCGVELSWVQPQGAPATPEQPGVAQTKPGPSVLESPPLAVAAEELPESSSRNGTHRPHQHRNEL
ncbi:hypothetical protein LIA77_09231 [Sarocladium implicatum]|nr:hypothetical protein LIA77_09231 [Sarocladium implicatum]